MQRIAIGDFAYLWMGNPGVRAPSLLITSHGDAIRDMTARAMVAGRWLPPMLHYFSLHGFSVNDPGFENTVTTSGSPTPIESIRADRSYDYILSKYQDSKENTVNFMKNNKSSETYALIEKSIDQNKMRSRLDRIQNRFVDLEIAYKIKEKMPGTGERIRTDWPRSLDNSMNYHLRDVLTIRKGGIVNKGVHLSRVLTALYEREFFYSDIICSFCRGDR